jgi:hypothetical protein
MNIDPTVELKEFKTGFFRWLFGQDSSTVLLFGILAALGYGAFRGLPALVDRQIKETNQIRTDFGEALKSQQVSFDKAIERCCRDHETASHGEPKAIARQ